MFFCDKSLKVETFTLKVQSIIKAFHLIKTEKIKNRQKNDKRLHNNKPFKKKRRNKLEKGKSRPDKQKASTAGFD
ncbi:hypothetical protein CAG57_15195 [Vibrio sp. V30_P3S12P165]|uniref:hypothetical protein n=1 Tax=unclassified Vibrio TaxID=2614977 RepID=UPI0013733F82|nr:MULTISPECIES: hypothetical protein [unclassified Vibrio]NAW69873.1 hypothetical protein [Vibrio sp. V28_P6S34P95]NAX06498.1 hypothetical protein [Vibrio sp. V30_P3S12P165]